MYFFLNFSFLLSRQTPIIGFLSVVSDLLLRWLFRGVLPNFIGVTESLFSSSRQDIG